MKRAGFIAGLAAFVVLAVLGYLWWEQRNAGAPVTAELSFEAPETAKPEPTELASKPSESAKPEPKAQAEAAPGSEPGALSRELKPAPSPGTAQEQPQQDRIARISPRQDAGEVEPVAPPAASRPRIETRDVAPPSGAGPAAVLPSFDIVRVEPNGEAVLAGRATPRSAVTLLDAGQALAEVPANPNGEWVILLRDPLPPGSHELGLESRLSSGETLLSENVVVVSVPEPPRIAQAPVAPTTPAAVPPASSLEAPPSPAPAPASPAQVAAPSETVSPAPEAETVSPVREGETATPTRMAEAEKVRPLAVLMPRSGEGPSRVIQSSEPVPRHLGQEALLLETVDYDAAGQAVIGGRGMAGVLVMVYLNGRSAGRTVIGANGRWEVTLEGKVPFGVHTLRVDQIDASGKVVARVESPFSRGEIQTAMAKETAVIVQPGNSLWRIARRVYGEGLRYTVIFEANQNQIRDPDLIYPGQVFVVPETN